MMNKKYGACLNHFSKNWIPVRGDLNKRVCYGHDLENLWLSIKANNLLGLSLEGLVPSFQRTFGYTLKYGYDRKKGGVFDHGPIGGKANAYAKVWWSQAEALVAGLEMYLLTQEKVYLSFFLNTLNWVIGYQVDWSAGEWHQRVYRRGKILGAKAEAWKTPYHNGRAMIHCLELLNDFE
jgi:mannobiose 2-epimerase